MVLRSEAYEARDLCFSFCFDAACGSRLRQQGCRHRADDSADDRAHHGGWITADSLRVRGGAGMQYDIIGGLVQGDRVEITGKSGDWYAIRFGETETGYVSGQYLTFEDPSTATTEK